MHRMTSAQAEFTAFGGAQTHRSAGGGVHGRTDVCHRSGRPRIAPLRPMDRRPPSRRRARRTAEWVNSLRTRQRDSGTAAHGSPRYKRTALCAVTVPSGRRWRRGRACMRHRWQLAHLVRAGGTLPPTHRHFSAHRKKAPRKCYVVSLS